MRKEIDIAVFKICKGKKQMIQFPNLFICPISVYNIKKKKKKKKKLKYTAPMFF